jgi:diguanylate cyclase (GGDEF)-like protein
MMRPGAVVDKLTGLLTWRYWQERAAQALERAGTRATALLLVDLDGVTLISDPAAEEAVRAAASVLRETLRATDLAGRYGHGGDGFLVLLPARDRQLGELVARRIRARIRRAINLPASIGLAVNDPSSARVRTLPELVHQADAALLSARTRGGDQIVVAGASSHLPV